MHITTRRRKVFRGMTPLQRVLARTRRKENGCIEWTGYVVRGGYGRITVEKRGVMVHKLVYESIYGVIPPDKNVCHKCDNPCCINPDHLFLGTQEDNIADKVSKNRQARGEGHGQSVLTEEDILLIRKLYVRNKRGLTKYLSERFGVSTTTIKLIANHKAWKHL